jgi:hypothetical protein
MSKPNNPPLVWTSANMGGGIHDIRCEVTLRDLFAAFALAGLEADPNVDMCANAIAEAAYADARAMLAEREKAS